MGGRVSDVALVRWFARGFEAVAAVLPHRQVDERAQPESPAHAEVDPAHEARKFEAARGDANLAQVAQHGGLEADAVAEPGVGPACGNEVVLHFGADVRADDGTGQRRVGAEVAHLARGSAEAQAKIAAHEDVGGDLAADLHEERNLPPVDFRHVVIGGSTRFAHGDRVAGAQAQLKADACGRRRVGRRSSLVRRSSFVRGRRGLRRSQARGPEQPKQSNHTKRSFHPV